MKIPTANVIVGFNRDIMDRLFTQGATYKNLIQEITVDGTDDILLFDNEANPNFISFEHTLAIGASMRMRLVLIDPTEEFETRFFTDSVVRNVAGWSHQTVNNPEGSELAKERNKSVIASLAKWENKYYSGLAAEYSKHYGNKEIFIAYGVGDNLDLWAGPHRVILTGADISVKGARKITLDFAPTPNELQLGNRRGAYNEVVNLNLAGLLLRYDGESQRLSFTHPKPEDTFKGYGYDPLFWLPEMAKASASPGFRYGDWIRNLRHENLKALQGVGYDHSFLVQQFDIHAIVVDTIRNYVQNATGNPNVIVLLPNINIICRQALEVFAKNSRVDENLPQITDPDYISPPAGPWVGHGMSQEEYYEAFELYNKGGGLGLPGEPYELPPAPTIASMSHNQFFIDGVLSSFGLDLRSLEKSKLTTNLPTPIPTGTPGMLMAAEKSRSAKERYEHFYSDRIFTSVLEVGSRQGIPNHTKAIKEVIEKIQEQSKEEYQIEFVTFSETDTKILDLWSKGIGSLDPSIHYTFGGYNKFDESREAIVVGDLALIQEYLYGSTDINKTEESINKIKDKAAMALTKEAGKKLFDKYADFSILGYNFGETFSGIDLLNTEDYALAAVKQLPLHPLDKVILGDNIYNKTIRDIIFPPVGKQVGSFGDISYLPDEFAYSDVDFSDEGKNYIKEEGIPIFRYNTQHPNILSMNFKYGPIYFAQLVSGFQKEITRKAAAIAEGLIPTGIGTFPIRTRGAALAYLKQKRYIMGNSAEREKIIAELASRISDTLIESTEGSKWFPSAENAANNIAAILVDASKNDLKGYLAIDAELPGNPHSLTVDMIEGLYRKALQMSIKTLPTFHLSKIATVNSPCLVLAQDAPIKQSRKNKRTGINSFFSGQYKIMGFKHTISGTAIQSEFKLTKNTLSFSRESELDIRKRLVEERGH